MKYLALLLILPLFGMTDKPIKFVPPVNWCSIEYTTPTEYHNGIPLIKGGVREYGVYHDGIKQAYTINRTANKRYWKPTGKCPECVQLVTKPFHGRDSKLSECLNT